MKTRLQTKLTGEEAAQIQLELLKDGFLKFEALKNKGIDLFLAYSDGAKSKSFFEIIPDGFEYFPQLGDTIGDRMDHAMKTIFAKGYEKVVLTGSDIPNLNQKIIQDAFDKMEEVVIGPSCDGGYYLIGSTYSIDLSPIFQTNIGWGKQNVLQETIALIAKRKLYVLPTLKDIDYPEDLVEALKYSEKDNYFFNQWLKENRGRVK
ncbi:transferase 1, rSAM/selenodomain-associated [Enterococcus hermanniensis]|uniref:Transferase 1, rSAM/selenodomain-associated n=1 Tax=Enterococcus hermanniensis TaxID=249189 RepID=A0A1L8TQP1_9ENTE|nr:transferase 1, rSAM/selenodomain-associated [Enterococcus hermanniensis]